MDHFESWKDLLNPEFYIKMGGFWLVLFIIFAETGLFVGFFLPGDSLLFISGIYAVPMITETFGIIKSDFLSTVILASAIAIAAILGNMVGYWFGRKSGPTLYERPDSFLFKKKYLFKAHDFYEEHGRITIIAARFLPIVRTFAPIVAGIVGMEKGKFMLYNIIGAIAWSFSLIFAGHYLDKLFLDQFGIDLKRHLEIIILFIVVITTAPVIIKMFFGKDKKQDSI
ncbi:DedA family protein [Riemerella anatipestifer]|uniref:DedA family protein n=1 Tax=Riemerella anatipestifer TaxID=34085 RepID=UPI001C6DDC71|nr:VTT domain-containing protein [Riemerella anatipestifer]QYQ96704.1 VTT domain-containing protein [Riemerella anatipestifer]